MNGRPVWNAFFLAVIGIAVISTGMVRNACGEDQEVLKYRLVKGKTHHLDNEATAKSYVKSLKSVGCESKLASHGGHFDLFVPAVSWKEATFSDHASVAKWDKWLKSLGFETQHHH